MAKSEVHHDVLHSGRWGQATRRQRGRGTFAAPGLVLFTVPSCVSSQSFRSWAADSIGPLGAAAFQFLVSCDFT